MSGRAIVKFVGRECDKVRFAVFMMLGQFMARTLPSLTIGREISLRAI